MTSNQHSPSRGLESEQVQHLKVITHAPKKTKIASAAISYSVNEWYGAESEWKQQSVEDYRSQLISLENAFRETVKLHQQELENVKAEAEQERSNAIAASVGTIVVHGAVPTLNRVENVITHKW